MTVDVVAVMAAPHWSDDGSETDRRSG